MHSAMSDEILEVFDWPPEGGGRTILFLGRFQRIIPGIVQALQHHQVPAGTERHHRQCPAARPALCPRHQHERQPVRRDRRMEKRHGEAGGGDGREHG